MYLFTSSLNDHLPLHCIVTLSVHIHPGLGYPLNVPDIVPLPPDDPPHAPAGHAHGEALQPGLLGDGLLDQDLRQLDILGQTSDTTNSMGLSLKLISEIYSCLGFSLNLSEIQL